VSYSHQPPVLQNTMLSLASVVLALSVFVLATPTPAIEPEASDCTGTISSLDDVAAAVKCTTVVINSFTVPAGEQFTLSLASGSTVTMSTCAPSVDYVVD
jgi:polygalacturonase